LNIDNSTGVRAFRENDRMRVVLTVVALALVVITPPLAYAADRDARNGKPYKCNPQAECLARASRLQGAAAAAARRDCGRMPTSGTCFSPDDAHADRPGKTDVDRAENPDRKRR
jgi:hypothetical protein